jgi:hypothetical protein
MRLPYKGRNAATQRRGYTNLKVLAHVLPHLVMPVGPFVSALRAPVVQVMSNSPAREHRGHLVGRPAVFPGATAGREVDVAAH